MSTKELTIVTCDTCGCEGEVSLGREIPEGWYAVLHKPKAINGVPQETKVYDYCSGVCAEMYFRKMMYIGIEQPKPEGRRPVTASEVCSAEEALRLEFKKTKGLLKEAYEAFRSELERLKNL